MTEQEEQQEQEYDRLQETNEFRKKLEAQYGKVWNTDELVKDFSVRSFLAPFCMVTRRSDSKRGTLEFTHMPRFYFDFKESA